MGKPLLSVVIPAFNEEKYLPSCLNSLKMQNFTDFEIIVVDNNSTDDTSKIARDFGVRVVKETVQGMIPSREKGFSEAKSEIIARTDADAILPPNWLSKIYHYFQLYPRMVALTGGFIFPEATKIQEKVLQIIFNQVYIQQMKIALGHHTLNGPNYALRKSSWRQIQAHKDDRMVHEDIDLSCHLYELGEIRFFPGLQVAYSLRRWKRKFWRTMFEYGIRNVKTVLIHHPNLKRYEKIISKI